MSQDKLLVVSALVASIILLMQLSNRLYPIIAVVITGIETLMLFNILHLSFSLAGLGLFLILGVGLAIVGVLIYMKVGGKTTVSCATIVALVGILQALHALRIA